MLPSMPALLSLCSENSNMSEPEDRERDNLNSPENVAKRPRIEMTHNITKLPDLSSTSKKSSPLKHVTPILKKYTSRRKIKGSKLAAATRDVISEQRTSEKKAFRPIIPKPTFVVIAPKSDEVINTVQGDILSAADSALRNGKNLEKSEAEVLTPNEPSDKNTKKLCKEQCIAPGITEITTIPDASGDKAETPATVDLVRKDNEDDIAALMRASTKVPAPTKIRSAMSKKKTKLLKDMEATLQVLSASDDPEVKEQRDYNFALEYFNKVKQRLGKDTDTFQKFVQTCNEYGQTICTVPELYRHIVTLLKGHKDLAEEFVAFLLPGQAFQCGRFMEYLKITKCKELFEKLDMYYAKQPHLMKKIYPVLSALLENPNITADDIRASISTLFKGNIYFIDRFMELLPQAQPPESIMNDYEPVPSYYDDNNISEEDLYENIDVPEFPDPYGGDNCICSCHNSTDEKFQKRSLHCIPCGTKYIHGRVYVQTGKGLRPAKIVFHDSNYDAHIQRLSAKECPPKGRRRRRSGRNASPAKQPLLSPVAKDCEEVMNTETGANTKFSSPKSGKPKVRTGSKSRDKATSLGKSLVTQSDTHKCLLVENASKENINICDKVNATDSNLKLIDFVRPCRVSMIRTDANEYAIVSPKVSLFEPVHKVEKSMKCFRNEKVDNNLKKDDRITSHDLSAESVEKLEEKANKQNHSVSLHEPDSYDSAADIESQFLCEDYVDVEINTSDSCSDEEINLNDHDSDDDIVKDGDDTEDEQKPEMETKDEIVEEEADIEDSSEEELATKLPEENISDNEVDSKKDMSTVPLSKEEALNIEIQEHSETESAAEGHELVSEDLCLKTEEVKLEIVAKVEEQDSEIEVSNEERRESNERTVQSSEDDESLENISWTRDEDRTILESLQTESEIEDAFTKIAEQLPHRTMNQIRRRFERLMSLLQEMTGVRMPEK